MKYFYSTKDMAFPEFIKYTAATCFQLNKIHTDPVVPFKQDENDEAIQAARAAGAGGRCFMDTANLAFVICLEHKHCQIIDKLRRVCHGVVWSEQHEAWIFHSWIELGLENAHALGGEPLEFVCDYQHEEPIPKATYYKEGKIRDVVTYTMDEVRANIDKFQDCGPWDGNLLALGTSGEVL